MSMDEIIMDSTDDDQELGLSRTALNRLIKDTLGNMRVALESRDLLQDCCVQFIKTVGTEANRVCAEDERKMINQEHIFKALHNLGFGRDYMEAASAVLGECNEKKERRQKRQKTRLDKCGIPEEELLRKQQELIDKAREEQSRAEASELARYHVMIMQQEDKNGQQHKHIDDDYDQ